MQEIIIRIIQFMLSISLLVLLHEGGHFFFAKLFGVRVEKFYLFFDPWFHLFEFKPKHSETTYGIGWLPLGGYCKIAGMIDESFDTDQMKKPAEKWEFRSKPAWQRLLIMIGGVTVNFVLALFIYSMIMLHWGENYISMADMTYGMQFNQEAKAMGFKDHDILVGTEKRPFKEFDVDVFRDLSEAHTCYVIRNGKLIAVSLPGKINMLDMLKNRPQFMRPYIPNTIDSVVAGSNAARIGIKAGDRILAFNGKRVNTFNDFSDIVAAKKEDLAKGMTHSDSVQILTMPLVLQHKGAARPDTVQATLSADASGNLVLGMAFANVFQNYKETHIKYSLAQCFPAGVKYGWHVLTGYVDDMKYVATADGAKSLGGFGAIGSLFPGTWNWYMFWKMTAFLSIILAFMNILPIPALDGGHVLFLLYEMITRRKPSEKFLIRAEYVGIAVLLLLMVVANLNDVLRWLGYM